MTVYHGAVVSVNANDDVFQYLVEHKGRIVYVGDTLPKKYRKAPVVELGKRALIPPFADTHQHFASFSAFNAGLNVMEARSNAEILDMVDRFAADCPSKTLIAFGASPYSVEERRLVSRGELDTVTHGKPLFLVKYDGHACVVNTALLDKLPGGLRKMRGYHADTGEMNQEAFFRFSDYISSSLSLIDLFRNMQDAVDFMAARGIGMVNTVSGVGFALNLDITFEKIFAKALRNGFQLRVFPQPMKIRVATSRRLPRIGGCFESALDGCFGSHDAAMNEPYTDAEGGSGVLYYSDEKVTAFCKEANRAGLRIEMHAIGDKAFDQAAKALKAALDDCPREDHRHGIIHDCLPTEAGIHICRDYHIQMPVQSAFIHWKQEPDEYLTSIMGAERVSRLNPIRTFRDNGIVVSFGSDAPCTTPDPIVWMDKAVNNGSESVTIQDALRMCTINGYYATFDDRERGSLETGKIADMVLLSENPYEAGADHIRDIRVEKLILGGEDYRSCKRPVGKAILDGLTNGSRSY